MLLTFHKYQGCGNDFIMIDNREGLFEPGAGRNRLVAALCHRRFGIGADGLILLEKAEETAFRMVYFNSDGGESTLCGNGGRCAGAFAKRIGLVPAQAEATTFEAVDGPHELRYAPARPDWVMLKMNDVRELEPIGQDFFLDTGSPHYVRRASELEGADLLGQARAVRYGERFAARGTNFNLVRRQGRLLEVRTYERGVEDETLACGTGVTAAALVEAADSMGPQSFDIRTPGGELRVRLVREPGLFRDIWLEGPATFVFEGQVQAQGIAR